MKLHEKHYVEGDEERAAHLLYFVIKDYPFTDGNKRIGSFVFLLFLQKIICLSSRASLPVRLWRWRCSLLKVILAGKNS